MLVERKRGKIFHFPLHFFAPVALPAAFLLKLDGASLRRGQRDLDINEKKYFSGKAPMPFRIGVKVSNSQAISQSLSAARFTLSAISFRHAAANHVEYDIDFVVVDFLSHIQKKRLYLWQKYKR